MKIHLVFIFSFSHDGKRDCGECHRQLSPQTKVRLKIAAEVDWTINGRCLLVLHRCGKPRRLGLKRLSFDGTLRLYTLKDKAKPVIA